ncbi:hypothetical protein ACFQH3_11700 [Haladaptatus sp. GCM10025707]|uniref:DUF7097 family protein n=1 Tax=unclassified Haladaptatus TaxID=2622732 RepID=UPI0023E7F750|nr:hypothetical protein [Haladaptatus sp. QDMS2]
MAKTPQGTSVGVDDPYAHVERCDHLTDDGRCRYAFHYAGNDPEFAAARKADDFQCPVVDPESNWEWRDCPHFRSTEHNRECARCGLEERLNKHSTTVRPLLEEHHLSYADREAGTHEITVFLCRWCHAKIHNSFARIDDDASPDPEAIAEGETRRGQELDELGFQTASERRKNE